MPKVFIGLGSNLGDSLGHLKGAVNRLAQHPQIVICASSPIYRSKPYGPQDQPDYLNSVVEIETHLSAEDLLIYLWSIEKQHDRQRTGERWTARTLDLDILLYADAVIKTERLTVPHPEMRKRSFVIYPLFDIAGDLPLPDDGLQPKTLKDCMKQCPKDDLVQLDKQNK